MALVLQETIGFVLSFPPPDSLARRNDSRTLVYTPTAVLRNSSGKRRISQELILVPRPARDVLPLVRSIFCSRAALEIAEKLLLTGSVNCTFSAKNCLKSARNPLNLITAFLAVNQRFQELYSDLRV